MPVSAYICATEKQIKRLRWKELSRMWVRQWWVAEVEPKLRWGWGRERLLQQGGCKQHRSVLPPSDSRCLESKIRLSTASHNHACFAVFRCRLCSYLHLPQCLAAFCTSFLTAGIYLLTWFSPLLGYVLFESRECVLLISESPMPTDRHSNTC